MTTIFIGLLVDCREDWSLRAEQGLLVVREGSIVARHTIADQDAVLGKLGGEAKVVRLSGHQFIMPGLIDTHIHASQFPNAGLALDLTLLDWLERYTFPTEAGLKCTNRAKEVYSRCVKATLASGTTTACYFATIHTDSTQVLGEVCVALGQRAWVGKVCMDRNCPDIYGESSTSESLSEAEASVAGLQALNSPLVNPIVTPRFVPTCSRKLLQDLGALASSKGLHIQTHLSENKREVEWVKQLEPDCKHYTEVYKKSGLLGSRTILAHCVHLTDEEVEMVQSTGSGISHCPNSNFSLKSGVCNVQRLRRAGVKVGLGTDCSGGFSPSLLDAMRQAVVASNVVHFTGEEETPLSFSDALYLATRGSAKVLAREGELGLLEGEAVADFLLVDMNGHENTRLFGHESPEDIVHKFVFLSDDRNIKEVWVNGQKVKDTTFPPC